MIRSSATSSATTRRAPCIAAVVTFSVLDDDIVCRSGGMGEEFSDGLFVPYMYPRLAWVSGVRYPPNRKVAWDSTHVRIRGGSGCHTHCTLLESYPLLRNSCPGYCDHFIITVVWGFPPVFANLSSSPFAIVGDKQNSSQ